VREDRDRNETGEPGKEQSPVTLYPYRIDFQEKQQVGGIGSSEKNEEDEAAKQKDQNAFLPEKEQDEGREQPESPNRNIDATRRRRNAIGERKNGQHVGHAEANGGDRGPILYCGVSTIRCRLICHSG